VRSGAWSGVERLGRLERLGGGGRAQHEQLAPLLLGRLLDAGEQRLQHHVREAGPDPRVVEQPLEVVQDDDRELGAVRVVKDAFDLRRLCRLVHA